MLQHYNKLTRQLNEYGLNLQASFAVENLLTLGIEALTEFDAGKFPSLLLVGNKGGAFWQYLVDSKQNQGHCFDTISQRLVVDAITALWPEAEYELLYPNVQTQIPLQRLGQLAGWGRPSLLGLDIHLEHGTWFAYRTAILISQRLPTTVASKAEDVCLSCIEKSCVQACPATAVREIGSFDLDACVNQRIAENSVCADKCLARLACPVGQDYRYSKEQLAHHSQYSLASIKRYIASDQW